MTDLDETFDRYDQGLYPDIELISTRGLVESQLPEEPTIELVYGGPNPCALKSLPRQMEWHDLNGIWSDVTGEVLSDPDVESVLGSAASCLTEASGFEADSSDPGGSFLSQVDGALTHVADEGTWNSKMLDFSGTYVTCMREYVDVMVPALEKRRAVLVEENRDLLESMARDLVAAGYTP